MSKFDPAKVGLSCATVKDAIAASLARLEINDCEGEESEFIEQVAEAQVVFGALCRDVLAEVPAMVTALAVLHDAAADYSEHGKERHYNALQAAMEKAAAILARIDGAAPTCEGGGAIGEGAGVLPDGFTMERDQDGDPVLIPPGNVVIFTAPGEGWLVTADYMKSRDWNSDSDVTAACADYLRDIGVMWGEG